MTDPSSPALENLLHEERRFPPSPEFAAQANATAEMYDEVKRRPIYLVRSDKPSRRLESEPRAEGSAEAAPSLLSHRSAD